MVIIVADDITETNMTLYEADLQIKWLESRPKSSIKMSLSNIGCSGLKKSIRNGIVIVIHAFHIV